VPTTSRHRAAPGGANAMIEMRRAQLSFVTIGIRLESAASFAGLAHAVARATHRAHWPRPWEAVQGKPSLAPPGSPLARSAASRSMAFPRSARHAAEDATPDVAAFGDQAPRAAAALRDSRPDSAPSSDAGPWRLPRPTPAPQGACRPSHGHDLAKSRHWSARRLRQIRFGVPGPRRGAGGASAASRSPAGALARVAPASIARQYAQASACRWRPAPPPCCQKIVD
jgi:hypothetical protein